MSPELLSGMAGGLLSLLASYVPGLKQAYARMDSTKKSLIMAILVILAGIGSAAWSCSAPESSETVAACLGVGWRAYAQTILAALVANQAVHRITPEADPEPKPRKRRSARKA